MPDPLSSGHSPAFLTTRWSLVLRAADGMAERPEALESLCRSYWHPLYFFALILSRPALARADPEKGRFRTYLLAVLKHALAQTAGAMCPRCLLSGFLLHESDGEPLGVRFGDYELRERVASGGMGVVYQA